MPNRIYCLTRSGVRPLFSLLVIALCGFLQGQESPLAATPVDVASEPTEIESVDHEAHSGDSPDLSELEARVLSALEEGKSPKVPLLRMWSVARQDEAAATNFLATMERLAPEFSDPELAWDAQLYMAEAAKYLQDHERVDQIFGELMAQDPNLQSEAGRSASLNHAQALMERGEFDRGIEQLRGLWDISARYSPAEFKIYGRNLAVAYGSNKDWANMVEVGTVVMGDLEDFTDFAFVMGIAEAYRELEQYDKAAEIFQRLYNYISRLEIEDPTNRLFEFEQYSRSQIKFRLDWAKTSAEGKKHTDAALAAEAAKAAERGVAEVTAELASNTIPLADTMAEVAPSPAESTPASPESRRSWTASPAFWVAIGALLLVAGGAALRAFR